MDNEDFVRLQWVKPEKGWTDSDSHGFDTFHVKLDGFYFSDESYDKVWEQAAKFTRDRLLKIKDTREEINWLSNFGLDEVAGRLLNEALGRLAPLTKGLKSDA
jgi:hypothetical protein